MWLVDLNRHRHRRRRCGRSRAPSSLLLISLTTSLCFFSQVDVIHASSSSAGTAAIKALQNMDYRYFVAGGVCAATSHGITTPLDVIKTKVQASPELYANDKNIFQTCRKIIKANDDDGGPRVLLSGLGPTVVGYGIEGAMKFGIYEVLKPVLTQVLLRSSSSRSADTTTANNNNNNRAVATAYILASVVAGAVASVFLCPMESTRIKSVTNPEYNGLNTVQALRKTCRQDGFLSTFGSGMYAMLAKQIPYTMAKQVSFDVFAGLFYALLDNSSIKNIRLSGDTIKWLVSITAAFLASIVACIFSQPGDVILTETYKSSDDDDEDEHDVDKSSSFVTVIRNVYGRNGLSSFFTGTGARILHVGMIITSQLVIYDLVKQLLGLPATGSH